MTRAEVSLLTIAGGVVLVLTVILFDVFETMVLSRRVSRRVRITTLFYRLTWPAWRAAAQRVPPGNRRENFLTITGRPSLLLLIVCWAFGLLVAFALLHAGLDPTLRTADGQQGFAVALYMSGTTLFTLGLGDVASHGVAGKILTVLECGMGLGLLTLVISYLPALSGAFSAREVRISLLDARAGSPPTAMELLSGIEETRPANRSPSCCASGSAGRPSSSRATSRSRCSPTTVHSTTTSHGSPR